MKEKLNKHILEIADKYKSKYKRLLKLIDRFDYIAVFRHIRPDFDAFGSQMGMYTWLVDNFKDKHVVFIGEDSTLTPKCFPLPMEVDDSFFTDHEVLAIALDTSGKVRISDDRVKKSKYLVKIDHHPEVDRYGRLQIVDENMSAAGELLANMLIYFTTKGYDISKDCATYLFKSIAGDSNRFLYDSCTAHTFAICEYLMERGVHLSSLYKEMYFEDLSELDVTRYVMDNFKVTEHGVAYYILDKETLKRFNMSADHGKDNINLFDHFNGINIRVSASEDVEKNVWRISIRSSGIAIDKIAEKYHGGGHAQASGAKVKNLEELNKMLKDLDDLLK